MTYEHNEAFCNELAYAVAHSVSNDEISYIETENPFEAAQWCRAVYEGTYEVDFCDLNGGSYDVWAADPSDQNGMLWRVEIAKGQ